MSALPLIALATWAGAVALMDLTRHKVRWWWLLLGMIGAGCYRLVVWVRMGFDPGEALTAFVVVTANYSLWKLGWWGGGDAKTAMALVVALPNMGFIATTCLLILLISGTVLLSRRGAETLPQLLAGTVRGVRAGASEGERIPLAAVMTCGLAVYLGLVNIAAWLV
jgi:Flp pilus assembly protein protease CpaA